ncbi:VWA-like domain-containing protein [Limnohabitans sp. 2KL-3]|uniref:vWA domain-containing protein n=1 Tax=Limnohabitans sp. 2KL-3 TaxID=1100700 RepID=UPI000B801A0F|nr:VWA-like domain-containing protein [Limnohabitans sp. 2KL-3]
MKSSVIHVQLSQEELALKKKWRGILEGDRARLLLAHPFTAMIALNLEIVPVFDTRLGTAATDGRSLYFQIKFINQLTDNDRIFVLAHEVWHVVCGHLQRRQGRDPERWNIAVDHEVNAMLKGNDFQLPIHAIYFPSQEGNSAEKVYQWLETKTQPVLRSGQLQFDIHDIAGHTAKHSPDERVIKDPDYNPQIVDANIIQIWRERVVSVLNTIKNRGQLTDPLALLLNEIVQPKVPWQHLMRQFTQRVYGGRRSWLPSARRHVYRGLYLPGMRTDSLRLTVAIDTSGSTKDNLPVFLSELKYLLAEFDRIELTMIECDANITRVRVFTENNAKDLDGTDILGGGETDLRPPFKYIEKTSTDCFVYLTDGYGQAPSEPPKYPVLWILTHNGKEPANWGQVVSMPPNSWRA